MELGELSPLALEGKVSDTFRLCPERLLCSRPRPARSDAVTLNPAYQRQSCPLLEAPERASHGEGRGGVT